MKQLSSLKRSFRSMLLGVFALTALGTGSVQGALLNLTLLDAPDIASFGIAVTYDATTDNLIASGTAATLDDDGVGSALNILGGSFDLSATIDGSGTLSGGTLTIGGTVPTLSGFDSGTLLKGNLTAFGFPDAVGGGDPLEFLFDVTGGDAAGLYGPLGGIILTGSGFEGSFDSDWNNFITGTTAGAGMADVGAVPLPAAVWLFGSALLGLVGYARRGRA